MFLLVLLPFLAWQWVPARWHLLMAEVLLATSAVLLIMALLKLIRAMRASRDAQSRGAYRWHRSWTAAIYGKHLLSYLRQHGWRVISADVTGSDRLRIVGEAGRQHMALLLVKPGAAPMPDDLAWLRAEANALLISDTAMKGAELRRIGFGAIPQIGDRIDTGPKHRAATPG